MLTNEQKRNIDNLLVALRSGKYKQGQGSLCIMSYNDAGQKTGSAYCCLGVAAKVLGIDDEIMQTFAMNIYSVDPTAAPTSTGSYLPMHHAEKFGFPNVLQRELARKNDGHATFLEIADMIEIWTLGR